MNERNPAAQYLRMSKDEQEYSLANQAAWIREYAGRNGFEIVRTYEDGGKSGLGIDHRTGLQALLDDVKNGRADFRTVLVYDVSRWGRFQDTDESAYYEYICRKARVEVVYCAETFVNDGSLSSSVMKAIKRSMAGEYSRELSVKIIAGKQRLVEMGFRQGGCAGYGLRRLLVDRDRQPKQILSAGMQKSIQTDRIILVPGPAAELQIVKDIYDAFIARGQYETAIARSLNQRGVLNHFGRAWSRDTVSQVLTNPKYVGVNVYRRTSTQLAGKTVKNPPDHWIYRKNSFEPIVSAEQFERVREIMAQRWVSDEQLLAEARRILSRTGKLSARTMRRHCKSLHPDSVARRFGGFAQLYALVGYKPSRDFSYVQTRKRIRRVGGGHLALLAERLRAVGAIVSESAASGVFTVNQELTFSFVLTWSRESFGNYKWPVKINGSVDLSIIGRLKHENEEIMDYYVFPALDWSASSALLAADNSVELDVYRCADLEGLVNLIRRVPLQELA